MVEGQGMDSSVINGAGAYAIFYASNQDATFTFRGFTLTAFAVTAAISSESGNINVENIEVDGAGTSFAGMPQLLY